MRISLGLGLGSGNRLAGGGPSALPTLLSASPLTASSAGSNTASLGSITLPAGGARRVLAFITWGGSGCSDMAATFTGDGSPANMTKLAEQGTNSTLAGSFEGGFWFEIAEADIAGAGPYTIDATATHSGTASRMGIIALVIGDAGAAPSATETNSSIVQGSFPVTLDITPTTDSSLVLGAALNSTDSSGIGFAAGLTNFGARLSNGDASITGSATQDASTLTVTGALTSGREAMLVIAYPAT